MDDAIDPRHGITHPDFKDAFALMNAEVHELVKSVQFSDDTQEEVIDKTLQYVEQFRKYKNLNSVTTIRASLEAKGMVRPQRAPILLCAKLMQWVVARVQSQYEVASLANLCLSDVAEAKKLVPTLADGRFDGEEEASLKQILDSIQNAKEME